MRRNISQPRAGAPVSLGALLGSAEIDAPKKRKRGEHSTVCLNTKPVHIRPSHWKNLPGELGKTYNFCRKRDVSRDPLFAHLRKTAGRQRDFKTVRRNLVNPFFEMCLSRHSLVEGIIEINLEDMAKDLSKTWSVDPQTGERTLVDSKVTVSRISRFIDEVVIPFGLAYVQADGNETSPKSGMVWDSANGIWFPKILVLTDEFYRICGADLDKLNAQREQQLALRNAGITNPDELITVAEARKRKRQKIFQRSWDIRKEKAGARKHRNKLADKTLDERKHEVANALVKDMPAHELAALTSEQFTQKVWQRLNSMDLGVYNAPPNTLQ